ncbi:EDD domain protein [Paenibacillus selenitireducens]|uniref:EDD domain protein n=1 Tax=Paenibacillus selenitireducens TaxID=1324314 RepID=A0A1T2XFC8_9BACL|nr:DegV family protein [Paenibacillus selenitireducens]OPA78594.1 EDD domain protein [Paenibacillus selenitireducens]
MGKIRIVTDSTGDIPRELREQYDIRMVPLKVHFGDQMYMDSITIEPAQFYELLVTSEKLPTTSQPSPLDFSELYKELLADPDTEIISIHLSAAMSGTYQSAMLAKSMIEDLDASYEDRLTIVDSKSASYGFGQMVVMAARLAEQGTSKDGILEAITRFQQERKLYFLVDTLKFLQKGGRIGKASAVLGTLLNVKPILSIDAEGEVYAVDKVRGQKKAVSRVVELFKKDFEGKRIHIAAGYATERSVMEDVIAQMREQFDVASVEYTTIGSVIGTHVGPGVVAIFVTPI